LTAVRIIS